MTIEELELDRRKVVMTTIELLDREKEEPFIDKYEAMDFLKIKSESDFSKYCSRKQHPMPWHGTIRSKTFLKSELKHWNINHRNL